MKRFSTLAIFSFSLLGSSTAELLQKRRAMPGGYSPVAVDNEFVVEAATFAVSELLTSGTTYSFSLAANEYYNVKVVEASQQVVAGLNFRLTLLVQGSNKSCVGAFQTTIYNHFGDLEVTKWGDELSCTEAERLAATIIDEAKFKRSEEGSSTD
jgi:hypothetical protein